VKSCKVDPKRGPKRGLGHTEWLDMGGKPFFRNRKETKSALFDAFAQLDRVGVTQSLQENWHPAFVGAEHRMKNYRESILCGFARIEPSVLCCPTTVEVGGLVIPILGVRYYFVGYKRYGVHALSCLKEVS